MPISSLPPLPLSLQSRLFTSDLSYTIQSLKPAHKYYFCVGAQYQHATICTGLVQATTHTVGEILDPNSPYCSELALDTTCTAQSFIASLFKFFLFNPFLSSLLTTQSCHS